MNKKLIVSGCANCPYLVVWNDGKENGWKSISSEECRHPSFNKLLPRSTHESFGISFL